MELRISFRFLHRFPIVHGGTLANFPVILNCHVCWNVLFHLTQRSRGRWARGDKFHQKVTLAAEVVVWAVFKADMYPCANLQQSKPHRGHRTLPEDRRACGTHFSVYRVKRADICLVSYPGSERMAGHQRLWTRHGSAVRVKKTELWRNQTLCGRAPLPTIPLSTGFQYPEVHPGPKTKWKTPEIIRVTPCTVLSSMRKSHTVRCQPACDVTHPLVPHEMAQTLPTPEPLSCPGFHTDRRGITALVWK